MTAAVLLDQFGLSTYSIPDLQFVNFSFLCSHFRQFISDKGPVHTPKFNWISTKRCYVILHHVLSYMYLATQLDFGHVT